jgi:FkbM family methyltransferase
VRMFRPIAKKTLNSILEQIGLRLVRKSSIATYEELAAEYQRDFRSGEDITFLLSMPCADIKEILKLAPFSKSQIRQDLFVLSATNFKRDGFFVEFGATDGISLNNSYLLETEFSWKGILAEPARMWHKDLRANRKAQISTSCVWSDSGRHIEFIEASIPELSTAEEFMKSDSHAMSRSISKSYAVETISLNDLLLQHDVPKIVDYLSIDTEGSELQILSELDFTVWKFRVITVEHNFTEQRPLIHDLLVSNGYVRVCETPSRFDDWYLNRDLVETGRFLNA